MKALLLAKSHPVLTATIAFCLGASLILTMQKVVADTTTIYACVKTNSGTLRIVPASTSCTSSETLLSWNQQGPQGVPGPQGPPGVSSNSGLPFTCTYCQLTPFASSFQGKDFSKSQIYSSDFRNADIHGVNFNGGYLTGTQFDSANLTGADLSNLLNNPYSVNDSNDYSFVQANLSSANLSNDSFGSSSTSFSQANLNSANFSNTRFKAIPFSPGISLTRANLQGTDCTNASFNHADFTEATNGSTANFTGTTWVNTICADGTNSDDNGNTCVGHF